MEAISSGVVILFPSGIRALISASFSSGFGKDWIQFSYIGVKTSAGRMAFTRI